jgi:hypothetical protein
MKVSRRKFLTGSAATAAGAMLASKAERANAFFNMSAFWKKSVPAISQVTFNTTTTVNNQVWFLLTELSGNVYAGVGGAGNNDGVRLRIFTSDASYNLTAGANSLVGSYEFNAQGMTELSAGQAVFVGEPYANWTATICGFNFNSSGITSQSPAQTNGVTCYPARAVRCGNDWAMTQTYGGTNMQYATIWDGTTLTLSNSLSILGGWPAYRTFYPFDSSNVLYVTSPSGGANFYAHLIQRSGSTISSPQNNVQIFSVASPSLYCMGLTLSTGAVWLQSLDRNQAVLITRSGATISISSPVNQTLTAFNNAVGGVTLQNPRISLRESWKSIGTDQWLVPIQKLVSGSNYQVDIIKLVINSSTGAATADVYKSAVYSFTNSGSNGISMIPSQNGTDLVILNYVYSSSSAQPVSIIRVKNAL